MSAVEAAPIQLAYYGDDFTGSTAVMETLAKAGLRTVLFLQPPTPAQLERFPGLRCFGIAGNSRTLSPAQMEIELPRAFAALKASGARFAHYKICSTFDSSPHVGSVGKAIELGRQTFGENLTPLVVGAPVLGRYVAFGNLFARSGADSEPSRLDRHPTMSRHPVTPMDEADLRLNCARQTHLPVELVDLLKLNGAKVRRPPGPERTDQGLAHDLRGMLKLPQQSNPIVVFDTIDDEDLSVIGRLIDDLIPRGEQLFCVGSTGLEDALVAHWRDVGLLPAEVPMRTAEHPPEASTRREQIVVVSGSCSPVTERQIAHAVKAGFFEVPCESAMLTADGNQDVAVAETIGRARTALEAGRHVIFQTARGPNDRRRSDFLQATLDCAGATPTEKLANAGANLGRNLGQILERALQLCGTRRAIVCGGDTSTHVARSLGIEALEFLASTTSGAPRCRIHAPHRTSNDCEFIFKGGQVGGDSFLADVAREPQLAVPT